MNNLYWNRIAPTLQLDLTVSMLVVRINHVNGIKKNKNVNGVSKKLVTTKIFWLALVINMKIVHGEVCIMLD